MGLDTSLDRLSNLGDIKSGRLTVTLFALTSVDGKISTGSTDDTDFDYDLPKVDGVKRGLHQYYEIEQTTSNWSLTSGAVQAKLGCNYKDMPSQILVNFVVVDNNHLNEHGVRYLAHRANKLFIVTTNDRHPAYKVRSDMKNIIIILQNRLNFKEAFEELFNRFGCDDLTVQTGGTLNEILLRDKLIDYVDIVMAPVLVGGKDTPTLIDGESLKTPKELDKLGVLELKSVAALKDNYIRLRYKVLK